MKYPFLLSIIALFFWGCSNSDQAQKDLQKAQQLYENKQYAAAKLMVDSVRSLYPKEVEVLKSSLTLMRNIEKGESEQNIVYCDSMIPFREAEAEILLKDFKLEKDAEYEDIGNYIWKTQSIEKNVERSYIRYGVNEKGEIYMASVFFGGRPLNHTAIKMIAPDGSYAETASIPYDGGMNYRFKDLGNTTEVVTYKGENSIGVFQFLSTVPEKSRIKIDYIGDRPFSLSLSENDKKAMEATYNLAVVLNDIEAMKLEREKAKKKIEYINHKLENKPVE